MKFLSIEFIKDHSRIDFDCEDSLLEQYADSAEESLAMYLNRGKTVEEMCESLVAEYGKIPANIYVAGQMLVDVTYTHRSPDSPVSMNLVPYTFDRLIKPYMKL